MKLTTAMRTELARLVTLRLPKSYLAAGFTGFPAANLDMRSIEALERRGLAECIVHQYKDRLTPTYRATDAGRDHIKRRSL